MAISANVTKILKLQVPAGRATPAPPVGSTLGPHGVNAPQFVQQFNDATRSLEPGIIVPVIIYVKKDRSFTFEVKTPPAAVLIKKALQLEKASGEPNKVKVGQLSKEQVRAIAEEKMKDLNATTLEAAEKIIAGTARSMGVTVAS